LNDLIRLFSNSSGVYQIRNVINGKRYIGSAKNFSKRWNAHIYRLKSGSHHSPPLQNAYLKYGENSFCFEVLKVCPTNSILNEEQALIDSVLPEYNVCKVAGSRAGSITSVETREKLSKAITGMKRGPDTIARMRASQRARKHWPSPTEEVRKKISASMKGRPRPRTAEHSMRIGLSKRKLTDEDVIRMSEMHRQGVTLTDIAKCFGCSVSLVSMFKSHKKRAGIWN
jgi:group I intron endonuclease